MFEKYSKLFGLILLKNHRKTHLSKINSFSVCSCFKSTPRVLRITDINIFNFKVNSLEFCTFRMIFHQKRTSGTFQTKNFAGLCEHNKSKIFQKNHSVIILRSEERSVFIFYLFASVNNRDSQRKFVEAFDKSCQRRPTARNKVT